jgi:glycosyltransferase involved in cell wall biosynthesis
MKISVVMQVYLGDYPDSRTHAREKFVRAVHSFLAQTHPYKELIIVSDGCPYAKRIYELVYTSNPLIQFVWVEPDPTRTQKMYNLVNGQRFFRGEPRGIGLKHATGDIVCYMDSDDIMLPNYLFSLNAFWTDLPSDIDWASNMLRIFNLKFLTAETKDHKGVYTNQTIDLSTYGIHEDFFINICAKPTQVSCATYSLSHRRNIKAQWKDTNDGNHEDVDFQAELAKHHKGTRLYIPGYVVCHYSKLWDV